MTMSKPDAFSLTSSNLSPARLRTLDLPEAAHFLRLSPATLRQKAKLGLIPGAKPGKRWVFLESELAQYLRSLYALPGQAPLSDCTPKEVESCHSTNAANSGGCVSSPLTDAEYADQLGLQTVRQPRNITTG